MFSGIQELLLIALIIVGLIAIPRMVKPSAPTRPAMGYRPVAVLSWKLRLAVVLSILWPLAWALHLQPWRRQAIWFIVVGVAPVVLGWSLKWVLAGRKHNS